MFKRIFLGLLGMALSYLMIRYRKYIYDLIGKVSFAEQYLGSGGTITLIVLLAILTFIVSLMYMTGSLDTFLSGTLGQYFGGGK